MDQKNLSQVKKAYNSILEILDDFDICENSNEAFILFSEARVKLAYLLRQEGEL